MSLQQQQHNLHLLWRAGFGAGAEEIPLLASSDSGKLLARLMEGSGGTVKRLGVPESTEIQNLVAGKTAGDATRDAIAMSPEERKQLRLQSAAGIRNLNLLWMDEMVQSPAQLREKMALFWHSHFACRVLNVAHQEMLLHIIREHALGNFGELLTQVSKSAAMLQFLNNQQNKKQQPNENFARELMELFTIGRGQYTEQDVKEAARAFTGWGYSLQGKFVERPFFHDDGTKTVMGKTGRLTGDDVIGILLEQEATAAFITAKICRYFVHDTPDKAKVQELAKGFYASGYDIGKLMQDLFSSDWFYEEKHIGAKIKSPVELMVGLRRVLSMQLSNPTVQVYAQRLLGQTLFYPPNVAGWPGGQNWIDSSTLMTRLRLPRLFTEGAPILVQPKTDDDQQMGMPENLAAPGAAKPKQAAGITGARVEWETFTKPFARMPENEWQPALRQILLLADTGKKINLPSTATDREQQVKLATLALMSMPDYQMC